MSYSKIILTLIISSIFFLSCKDKKIIEPEPEEYFSFYADGKYFNYPQIKGLGFGGTGQTLKAWGAGTAGYIIRGYSEENSIASGAITIYIHGGQIPNQDTVILDGLTDYAVVQGLKYEDNDFVQASPLTGKVIFTQRTAQKLMGTFEFQAGKSGGGILTITQGKFSIIPTP